MTKYQLEYVQKILQFFTNSTRLLRMQLTWVMQEGLKYIFVLSSTW